MDARDEGIIECTDAVRRQKENSVVKFQGSEETWANISSRYMRLGDSPSIRPSLLTSNQGVSFKIPRCAAFHENVSLVNE